MAVEVVLPMLGITVERGKIIEWLKKEGDTVEKGEIIFVVEVEKATAEVESPASGVLAKIILPEGVEAPILSIAAVITAPGEELPARYRSAGVDPGPGPGASGQPMTPSDEERMVLPGGVPPRVVAVVPAARSMAKERGLDLATLEGTGPGGVIQVKDVVRTMATPPEESTRASTLARKLAEKEGIPLANIHGTGVRGRIMRADVSSALAPGSAPPCGILGTVIPMGSIRRVVSRRMSESAFTAPHIYFFTEVSMDPLLQFREQIAGDFERRFAVRPSVNDLLIKAVALNILDFPIMNGQVRGEEIHVMPEINVGLAVALQDGLIVPAVARADQSGLAQIVRERIDLVERARKGRLSAEEMERGTFTISSLAQYDITHFTAILNPPQSGILSIGKTDEKVVLSDGLVKTKRVAVLGLSVDHRIIDGAVAADFLQNLKQKIEQPAFTFLAV